MAEHDREKASVQETSSDDKAIAESTVHEETVSDAGNGWVTEESDEHSEGQGNASKPESDDLDALCDLKVPGPDLSDPELFDIVKKVVRQRKKAEAKTKAKKPARSTAGSTSGRWISDELRLAGSRGLLPLSTFRNPSFIYLLRLQAPERSEEELCSYILEVEADARADCARIDKELEKLGVKDRLAKKKWSGFDA
jgi:hypothetical protein